MIECVAQISSCHLQFERATYRNHAADALLRQYYARSAQLEERGRRPNKGHVYGLDNRFVVLCIQFKGFCAITS